MNKPVKMSAVTHPFKAERTDLELPEGLTIGQMLAIAQPDARQLDHAVVFVKGEIIPKEYWPRYRPKSGVLIEVRAFPVPRGGGGGDKNPMRTILMIAVIAVAFWAGPALAAVAGFTEGTAAFAIASGFAGGIVSAVGMLAVNAVAPIKPPQVPALSGTDGRDSPTLFIEGARNQIRPFSPVPVVLGTYRSYPPFGAKPYTEVIGDKQFVRMLFVWGVGPLSIDESSLKIGDTPITDFEGVQMEHREGYDTDTPLTLFPASVDQNNFSVLISQATGWVERTSSADADELSLDLLFPQGLVQYDANGNRQNASINIEINYREVGASPWLEIDTSLSTFQTTAPSGWLNKTGNDLDSITFTQNKTASIRHGIRWGVSSRGQYEIRVRRTTADSSSTQVYDTMYWSSIKTFTNEDPISTPYPVAATALIIQATDQLNNTVDEFNGLVTSVCKDWDSGSPSWVERATQNPAALFRHILQGDGISQPVADSRIDLDTLQEWHEFCDAKGFKFNMIRDFSSSIWDALADVAAAGRATPTQIDGKWSVVIEKVRSAPVSFITPRNSFDFKAEKFFVTLPHGWRIRFANEAEDYRSDERRVYKDGYSDANATLFETLELPGVTDSDQIYKLGRFRISQAILQPERWTFKQDIEYLTYQRGDRVAITHDILLVGLSSGRIKGVTLSGADVTAVELDEAVTMEVGQTYGIAIRTTDDARITRQVVNTENTTTTLTLSTAILGVGSPAAAAVEVGNIFGFGLYGEETDDASIIQIIPENNMRATIVAVPYREAIFDADSELIPTFSTNLTSLRTIPAPTIRNVVSDESALALGHGDTLKIRIGVTLDALSEEVFGKEPDLRVQIRSSSTSEPYYNAEIDSQEPGHIFIGNVQAGETYDIRIRFVMSNRLPGPWANIYSHLVVGKSTLPEALSNMTISVFGGQALIRWDRPSEIDVLFGGEVIFRHSQALTGATWSESVSIGTMARARTLFAVLPLKSGTYMARVFDVAGNPSAEVTSVSTKQASVLTFLAVTDVDEATTFSGTHDNTVVDTGSLRLVEGSPRVLTGTYNFIAGMDLTTVKRVRLTTRISAASYNINSNIDDRLDNIDLWEDFDGDTEAGADVRVYVRHTDDNPAGSPVTWSAWERLDSAEYEARGFEFKAVLTAETEDYNILVSELGVDAEEI